MTASCNMTKYWFNQLGFIERLKRLYLVFSCLVYIVYRCTSEII